MPRRKERNDSSREKKRKYRCSFFFFFFFFFFFPFSHHDLSSLFPPFSLPSFSPKVGGKDFLIILFVGSSLWYGIYLALSYYELVLFSQVIFGGKKKRKKRKRKKLIILLTSTHIHTHPHTSTHIHTHPHTSTQHTHKTDCIFYFHGIILSCFFNCFFLFVVKNPFFSGFFFFFFLFFGLSFFFFPKLKIKIKNIKNQKH